MVASLAEPVPASPPARRVDPASIRRVLLLRPRFVGDVCLTLPALEAVRESARGARVAYLVEPEWAPLLAGDDRIDEVIVAPRTLDTGAWFGVVGSLRRFAPDLAIDFFCNPRTALWTRLSGARIRVGYSGKGWRSALYTHHVQPRTLSAIEHHLASVTRLGWNAPLRVPRLHLAPEVLARACTELAAAGVPEEGRLVGFHPGARWPTRRWPLERFIDLARRFLRWDGGGFALVSGGPGEEAQAEEVVEALPRGRALALTGWPIERFVAAQARCAAFVCGDTGPLHTAVAAGTPTLGLISRNRPSMFFPYPEALGHRAYYARVECSPCDRNVCDDLRCLHRLSVEGAWALLQDMLLEAPNGAGPPDAALAPAASPAPPAEGR